MEIAKREHSIDYFKKFIDIHNAEHVSTQSETVRFDKKKKTNNTITKKKVKI